MAFPRIFFLGGVLTVALLIAASPSQAQVVDGEQTSDYLELLPSAQGEGWLAEQFSEFSSYPVIDRAIRLASEGNTGAARQELEQYLAEHPENLRARFMLAVLLHSTAQYRDSIEQATVFLDALPGFGPAHLYRGLSGAELGDDLTAALVDLGIAIESAEVSEQDRAAAIDIFIQAAIDAGQFSSALEQLDRQRDKSTYRYQRLRGQVLDGMERYDEARETFMQAALLAQTEEDRLNALKFAAESARKSGDVDGARTILLDALVEAPGDYTIMRQLAWVEISVDEKIAAWEWIMLALDSDPDVETRLFLINLLIEAEDFAGALQLLDRQLNDVGDDETLRRQLIETKFNLLVNEERYDDAFDILDEELEEVADIAYLVILLQKKANLHTQRDEYIEAGLAYQELLGYINDPNVLLSLARSFELGGDLKTAAEYLEQAADFIGLPGVAYQLVDIYLELGDTEAALRVLDKAATAEGVDNAFRASLLFSKADILGGLGRLDEQRNALEEAVFLDPTNQLYLLALGELTFALASYLESVQYFSQALELEDNLDTRRRLAYAQNAAGDLADAALNFEIVLGFAEPGSQDEADILNALGNLYSRLERYNEAARAFVASYDTLPGQPPLLLSQAATTLTVVEDWYGAADLYERALEEPGATQGLKNDIYERLAVVMERTDRPNEAARLYEALLDNQAMDAARRLSILRRLAVVSEQAKNFASATRAYKGMIDSPLISDEERRELLFRLAVASELAGDYDSAIQAYRDILSYEDLTIPERVDALKKMAVIANIAGRPEVASEAYRLLLAGEDLPIEERVAAAASLAFVAVDQEMTEDAMEDITFLLEDDRIVGEQRIGLLRGLAVTADLAGRPDVVAEAYEEIVSLLDHNDPERDIALRQLASAYQRTGRPELAVPVYQDLLSRLVLNKEEEVELLRNLAISAQLSGQDEVGLSAFQRIIELGTDDWNIYQAYGVGLRESGNCRQALRAFQIARDLGGDFTTDIYSSFCYTELGLRGLSLHYLRLAIARGGNTDMPLTQRFSLLSEIGFLYAETQQFKLAAKAWRAAVGIAPDPILTLRLARVERLAGEIDLATEHLFDLQNVELPPTLRAEYYDEIAEIELLQADRETALAAMDEAISLFSTPARKFRRGVILNELGELDEAIGNFTQAMVELPESPSNPDADSEIASEMTPSETLRAELGEVPENYTIMAALGYAFDSAERDIEAEHLLETVVRAQPDRLAPYTDLAYINKRSLYNEEASRWFELAIDNAPLYPIDPDEKLELEERLFDFRRENQTLNNDMDWSAFTIFRTEFGDSARFDPTGNSTLISQGGTEFAYRPDDTDWFDDYPLGFRNGEIFQVFVRAFWGHENDSLLIDRDTIQGGVGARWKPFEEKTFFLSGERLFRIGDESRNDWLLRASYSWDTGFDIEPVRDDWPFAQVFADIAYIPGSDWVLFLTTEGKYGHSFKYGEQTVITPHVVAGGFNTTDDLTNDTTFEFGPGISVKYWFDDTTYEAYRSSAEAIIQYRGAVDDDTEFSHGIVATFLVSF